MSEQIERIMSEQIERNKSLLLNILPENYVYYIEEVSISESTDIPTEVKLDAEFRVNVKDEESFERFLSDFSQSSGTSYNKRNQADKTGKKTALYGVRKCIHNVTEKKNSSELNKNNNKTGKCKEPGKNTNCPAEFNFSISSPCQAKCGNKSTNTHFVRNEYPLQIKLYYNHNHAIQAADALRFRRVSEETKKLFIDLFDEDVSPSSAYRRVQDYFDSDSETESFADRCHVPDYKWVFNFHAKYIKEKFGSSNGVDVYRKVKEDIEKYNIERGEELAKVKQTATGETIIAICDQFNKRVHENIPSAGDIMIMDATANLDRNDSKLFHLMCPTPVGGLPLGTLITTRADEATICEALELYKSLLSDKSFFGRGKDLGPILAITDDDAAERNALHLAWSGTSLLLCIFHLLQAVWTWLWSAEHKIEKQDRPTLINLVKKTVYAEDTTAFEHSIDVMKESVIYKKYENFKKHVEEKILPRYREWSLKERLENKLPTHNQNTTNCVEYSFRMTKDIQFSRLRAYNLTDLLSVCLDDSKLYTRRCVDVSHNRNYHLFTNQKSKYLFRKTKIDSNQIIQQTSSKYLVPSETIEDKLYKVDIDGGLCECKKGSLKGPCKHKALVAHQYKIKNFEILPKDNEKMRSFYNHLGTGQIRVASWFRPLSEETLMPEVDWNDDHEDDLETGSTIESMDEEENVSEASETMNVDSSSQHDSDGNGDERMEVLSKLKKSVFNLIHKIEDRFDKDEEKYQNAINSFVKQTDKLFVGSDSTIQKALFNFAKDVVQTVKRGKKKNAGSIPVQSSARSRRRIKHRGAGPSFSGRPTKEQSLHIQMFINDEDEITSHHIPSGKAKKKKNPHSLAAAVDANRAAERKH